MRLVPADGVGGLGAVDLVPMRFGFHESSLADATGIDHIDAAHRLNSPMLDEDMGYVRALPLAPNRRPGLYNFFSRLFQDIAPTMRRLIATFLLLFVFSQAVATAGQKAAPGHGGTVKADHVLMHWEGVAHHHDADGATHQDNSDESAQHMLADMVLGAAAVLLPSPLAAFSPERSPPPRAAPESSGPFTYPDGPRRPPRLLA